MKRIGALAMILLALALGSPNGDGDSFTSRESQAEVTGRMPVVPELEPRARRPCHVGPFLISRGGTRWTISSGLRLWRLACRLNLFRAARRFFGGGGPRR